MIRNRRQKLCQISAKTHFKLKISDLVVKDRNLLNCEHWISRLFRISVEVAHYEGLPITDTQTTSIAVSFFMLSAELRIIAVCKCKIIHKK